MRESRKEILTDIQSLIIGLYLTYDMDDTSAKKKVVSDLLDIINDQIIDSFETEEPREELIDYLYVKVDELFGEGSCEN